MTTLHLVRHAAHEQLGRVLTGRTPGVHLSAEGRAQAGLLSQRFASLPITAVMSSPMERAQETASPIAARLGLLVLTEPGLDEVDFGAWAGARFDALEGSAEWLAWNRFRSFAPAPGGESMAAAQVRALGAIARLHRAYPDGELVAVSHSDMIKAVLAHFLGIPLDLFHRIEIGPASRSVLRLFEHDARIDVVNVPPGA